MSSRSDSNQLRARALRSSISVTSIVDDMPIVLPLSSADRIGGTLIAAVAMDSEAGQSLDVLHPLPDEGRRVLQRRHANRLDLVEDLWSSDAARLRSHAEGGRNRPA